MQAPSCKPGWRHVWQQGRARPGASGDELRPARAAIKLAGSSSRVRSVSDWTQSTRLKLARLQLVSACACARDVSESGRDAFFMCRAHCGCWHASDRIKHAALSHGKEAQQDGWCAEPAVPTVSDKETQYTHCPGPYLSEDVEHQAPLDVSPVGLLVGCTAHPRLTLHPGGTVLQSRHAPHECSSS